MESVRLGRQYRALRIRQRLRQDDLSAKAGVSRSEIGRAERGGAGRLRVETLDRIAAALGARLELRLSWNGEGLDRLLDADHAALVDTIVQRLTASGWQCAIEVSFSEWGERGSIDVMAVHPRTATALVVEVKSVVPDVQATLMTLDRKARLAPVVAKRLGWSVTRTGRLLVVGESRTSRRRVETHAAIFDAALPARGIACRAWLNAPDGGAALAGLMFLSSGHRPAVRHRVAGARAGSPTRPRSTPKGDGVRGLPTVPSEIG